ncbi:hypothetical protein N9Y42_04730 [Mariniblastus sp.]|nr:hypothetical protein [Mariniblastus sp.]
MKLARNPPAAIACANVMASGLNHAGRYREFAKRMLDGDFPQDSRTYEDIIVRIGKCLLSIFGE